MEGVARSMKDHSRCGTSGQCQNQAGCNSHHESEVNVPEDGGEECDHPEHAVASTSLPVLGQIRQLFEHSGERGDNDCSKHTYWQRLKIRVTMKGVEYDQEKVGTLETPERGALREEGRQATTLQRSTRSADYGNHCFPESRK